MSTLSPKHALQAPELSDPANIVTAVAPLRDRLDAIIAIAEQGTLATRPVTGKSGRLYYATDEAVLYFDHGTGWVAIGARLPGAGLVIGVDVNLYRRAANSLATDDELYANLGAASQVGLVSGNGRPEVLFGTAGDTNLYRSAADTLKTDDALEVVGNISSGGQAVVKTNDARMTNQRAPLSPETALRTIRGTVRANGTIDSGSGFTVTRSAVGRYTVTFGTAFAANPSVDLTPVYPGTGANLNAILGDFPVVGSFLVRTFDPNADLDLPFCFTASGPA